MHLPRAATAKGGVITRAASLGRSYPEACWASFGVVKVMDASGVAALISRRAEPATFARTPPATLRLAGRLAVLARTVGVFDLLSSLRLRSGLSLALVAFSFAFLALARFSAAFSASFLALRSAFFSSLAFRRNRSARAS